MKVREFLLLDLFLRLKEKALRIFVFHSLQLSKFILYCLAVAGISICHRGHNLSKK